MLGWWVESYLHPLKAPKGSRRDREFHEQGKVMRMHMGGKGRYAPARQGVVGWLLGIAATLTFLGGVSAPTQPARASVTATGFTVGQSGPTSTTTSTTPTTPAVPVTTSIPHGPAPSIAPLATAASTPIPSPDTTSDAVGATVGQFRIDEAGQLSYAIPLYSAPGTAGVMPQVSLTYNSQGGNTPLGRGFSISGQSALARCRASREAGDFFDGNGQPSDGDPQPINFSTTDRFCLDGQRLLVVSGTYGADGAEYRLETDPYTRIYSRGGVNATDVTYTGPQYFEVQRKDGSTSYYGNTSDSKLLRNGCIVGDTGCPQRVVNWALNRLQDSTGNYIDYTYNTNPGGTNALGEITLAAIKYTGKVVLAGQGGSALAPYAQIRFTYDTLADTTWKVGYQAGSAFTQSQRLTGVLVEDQIDTSPRTLRYYKPGYATSASGSGARILTSIKECRDASEAVCYPPTTFTWSGARYRFETSSEQTPSGPNFSNLVSYKFGDVDGDGRLDMVWWKNSDGCPNSTSRLYVSFGDKNAAGQITYDTRWTSYCAPRNLQANDDAWQLLDYDGDNRDDLLIAGAAGSNWKLHLGAARVGDRSTPFTTGTDQFVVDGTVIPVASDDFRRGQLADFNGDGLLDFMVPDTVQSSGTYGSLLVRFLERQADNHFRFSAPYQLVPHYQADDPCVNEGGGGANDPLGCYFDFFDRGSDASATAKHSGFANDVNGDGRADILFRVTQDYDNGCTICLVDPGKAKFATDAMLPQSPTAIRRNIWGLFTAGARVPANGLTPAQFHVHETFHDKTVTAGGDLPNTSVGMYLTDLNGDGLADIFYKDAAVTDQYRYRLNTGSGFLASATVAGVVNGTYLQLADIDGDGRADLIYPPGSPSATSRSFKVRHWLPITGAPAGNFGPETDVPGNGAAVTYFDQWINLFADVDGDGATDFLRAQITGGTSTNFVYGSRAASGERYHPRDTITDITNGYGAKTTVTYQPLTNRSIYRRDNGSRDAINMGRGSPVLDALAPIYVASQATSPAPQLGAVAATSTVNYRYGGARMQGGGRGFLGFREVTTFDGNDSATTTKHMAVRTLYVQEFPYLGSPLYTEKVARAGSYTPDACASDPEALGQTCFYDINDGAFPAPKRDINDVTVSTSGNAWACNGTSGTSACPAPWGPNPTDLCPSTSASAPSLKSKLTPSFAAQTKVTASITPTAPQQPVFPYLTGSAETTYDLGNGAITATTFHIMCYEDGYGNVTHTITDTYPDDGNNAATRLARQVSTESHTNDAVKWRLGRLATSAIDFTRPSATTLSRVSDFTYDMSSSAKTGLLRSERVQKDIATDQDLRNSYVLDAYGNRTLAFTCSNDIAATDCDDASDTSKVKQHPVAANGEPTTSVFRYVRTEYDTRGRYAVRTKLPYFNGAASGNQVTELRSHEVLARNEFGDVTDELDANNREGGAVFGTLGRPYFQWVQTGATNSTYVSTTTTLRWCVGTTQPGTGKVSCPAGTVFRRQVATDGAAVVWTYHDVLGRELVKVTQSFNAGIVGKDNSAVCQGYDAHGRAVTLTDLTFLSGQGEPNFAMGSGNDSFCSGVSSATQTYYDVLGRITGVQTADNALTTRTYAGLVTSITDPRNKTTTETRNPMGEVTQVRDPGETNDPADDLTVTNEYNAAGDLRYVKRDAGSGQITSEVQYDTFGRKTLQIDPDTGTHTYSYNAAGELIKTTDAKNQATRTYIDALGRVWKRATGVGNCGLADTIFCSGFEANQANTIIDTYTFDTAANGVGLLDSESRQESGGANFGRAYTYDAIGRLSTRNTSFSAQNWTEVMGYDTLGRLASQQDASGYTLSTVFSSRGFLQALDDSRANRLYEVFETNARSQVTSERRGNTVAMNTTRTYDPVGRVATICSGANCALQDWTYGYDLAGNLTSRTRKSTSDPLHTDREEFVVDNLNRIKTATITRFNGISGNTLTASLSYDKLGNVCSKDGNAYAYLGRAGCVGHGATGSPHAVTTAFGASYSYDANGNQTGSDASGTANDRTITYDAQDQARDIAVGSPSAPTARTTFVYGSDGSRYRRVDTGAAGTRTTRYVGNVEIITREDGVVETKRYLGGAAIDIVRSNNANETRYVFGDHQGSVDTVASNTGGLIETLGYDAFGGRRNAATWQGVPASLPTTTTHGYTGHEHADGVGLIHMGARLYDPKLGRFVQADSQIDAGTQGLNRYSYVLNNPLTLTDPTGHLSLGQWIRIAVAVVITIYTGGAAAGLLAAGNAWGAVAVAALGGFAAGVVTTGTLQGGLYGAFSAALFFGIGAAFQAYGTPGNFAGSGYSAGTYSAKVLAHGIAGGVMGKLQGDSFGHGFVAAGFTEALGGKIDQVDASNPGFSASRVVAASLVGGTASALTGGKFGNGAVTAAFSRAFNDNLHEETLADKAKAAADAALKKAGVSGHTYASEDELAVAWSDAVHPVADKYEVEIGAKIFKVEGGYQVAGSMSDGMPGEVHTLEGPNLSSGKLVATIHTHPDQAFFSGDTAFAKWGDLSATNSGTNGHGDLVTAYNNRINSYLSAPHGVVLGWNYKDFTNIAARQSWATLKQGVYTIRSGH